MRTVIKNIPYGLKHDPQLPKGCKRYYFNKYGIFSFKRSAYMYIEIIASNDRNAIRKFKKYHGNTI